MSKLSNRLSRRKHSRPKVVIVMPAFNAGKTLRTSYEKLPKRYIDEIILVDDCSTDRTLEIAQKIPIRSYKNQFNLGYGGNLKICLTKALEYGADIIIEYHPDNQYDPQNLPLFIKKAEEGYDFALGSRFIDPKTALENKMPLIKFIANRALSFIDEFVLGIELSEFHSGFRMYTRKMLESVSFLQDSNDYLFSFEIIVQAVYKKMRIAQVPIACTYHPLMHTANLRRSAIYALSTFKTLGQYIISKFFNRPCGPFVNVNSVVCVHCGEKVSKKISEVHEGTSGKMFSIFFCINCQNGFTHPIPKRLDSYYLEKYYSPVKTRIYTILQYRRAQIVKQFKSSGKMLDIGCGDGSNALQFQDFGYVGIEAPFAVTRNPAIKTVGIEGMREKPNSYDAVTFWESFEHIKNPAEALRKSEKVLVRGGYIFIECPNFASPERLLFLSHWFHLDPPRHLSHFTPQGLTHMLTQQGFSVCLQKQVYALEYIPLGLAQSIVYMISPRNNLIGVWQRNSWLKFPLTGLLGALLFVTTPLSLLLYCLGASPILLTVAQKNASKK